MDRVLIDLNSVAHAAHQGTVLKAGDQETQAVFGTIKSIRTYRIRNPRAKLVGLWDGASWRKSHDPEYKANRTDDAKKREDRARFKSQMPFLRKALRQLSVPQLFAINLEADDLAAILSKRYSAQGDFVRLISGDRDWLQLVDENVVWEDHRDETRKVNIRSFKNATGYDTALQFVQSKALQGDTSDNLKGVGKIGEVGAADLISVWGRVEAFLADPNPRATWEANPPMAVKVDELGVEVSRKPKGYPKALDDFHKNDDRQSRFFHNMHMMNLLGELPAPEKLSLVKGDFDSDGFRSLCHELGFSSIYREQAFDTFTEPFRKLH